MSVVGENIRRERQKQHYSQNALAKKAGIAQATLNAIEASTKNPSVDTVILLASALDVTAAELLGEALPQRAAVLSPIERRLLAAVARLNAQGMEKVIAYAEDLCETEKYIRGAAASAV